MICQMVRHTKKSRKWNSECRCDRLILILNRVCRGDLIAKVIFEITHEDLGTSRLFIWRNSFLTEGTTKAKVMRHSKNKISVAVVRKGREADEVGGDRFYGLVDYCKDFGF